MVMPLLTISMLPTSMMISSAYFGNRRQRARHSITRSARRRTESAGTMPSARAAFRLTTSSNLSAARPACRRGGRREESCRRGAPNAAAARAARRRSEQRAGIGHRSTMSDHRHPLGRVNSNTRNRMLKASDELVKIASTAATRPRRGVELAGFEAPPAPRRCRAPCRRPIQASSILKRGSAGSPRRPSRLSFGCTSRSSSSASVRPANRRC